MINRNTQIKAGYQNKPDALRERAEQAFSGVYVHSKEPGVHRLSKEQTDLHIPVSVKGPKGMIKMFDENNYQGMGRSKDYERKR